jgi:prepilin-type N-terminal cleavage/methylation domain-containing protein
MRARKGFTLIELLIVVVIIGLLAAIAIPKFASTKENTFVGMMKSDLRNLASAQEAFVSDNASYYSGGLPNAALVYSSSPGVTIVISEATAGGWSATASHASTPRTCAIYVGNAAPVGPATLEGVAMCDPS